MAVCKIALGRTGRAIERSGRRASSPSPRRPWRTVCFLSPRTETREHSRGRVWVRIPRDQRKTRHSKRRARALSFASERAPRREDAAKMSSSSSSPASFRALRASSSSSSVRMMRSRCFSSRAEMMMMMVMMMRKEKMWMSSSSAEDQRESF